MKRVNSIFFYLLLMGMSAYSQTDQSPFKIWRLTSLSGQVSLRGNYRESETWNGGFYNKHSESYLNGIVQGRTQSYFVHPNFMLVNFNGIYNPETRRNSYIGLPDNSEKNTNEGWDASAQFFRKKSFTLTTNASVYNSLQNIDNITRISSKSNYKGATFSYLNKVVPFTLGFSHQKNNQRILDTERSFKVDQYLYQATANKSFGELDYHSFMYLHTDNTSLQNDIGFVTPSRIINNIDFYELNNEVSFDSKKHVTFSSSLAKTNDRGTNRFENFAVQENLNFRLPKRFVLTNNYSLRKTKQVSEEYNFQRFESALGHQLYESLTSRVAWEYSESDQSTYLEKRNKTSVDLKYVKKIRNGKLWLSYIYYNEYQEVEAHPSTVNIIHEEKILADNQITLLNNQYVDIQSIVVKNVNGSTIYQLNIDYIVVDRNPYAEIIRIPGGLIPNSAMVYVDYSAHKPNGYYSMNNNNVNVDLWLFKDLLNVYYRYNTQGYTDQSKTETQALNYFTRHVVGFRLDFYYLKAGAEYEYTRSSLLPYQGVKYFVNYQKMYRKIYITFNGNYTDYQMNNELARRRDIDLSSKVAYAVTENFKVNVDYMYRSMKGKGIDIDVHTAKLELSTNLHNLFLSAGTELYWNQSVSSKTNYKGAYIQLARNF